MAETKSCKMNLLNLTKNVLDRIYTLDPDNFCKIMGSILFKEPSEQQMIKLAFGPESTFVATIIEEKQILGLISPNASVSSQNQAVLDPLLATDQYPLPESLGFVPRSYPDLIREDYSLCNQEFLNLEKKIDSSSFVGNHYCHQDASLSGSSFSGTSRRSPSLPEFLIKPCHYFSKGNCKHGANCRYYHGQSFSDGYSQACCSNFNEIHSEENGFSPRSLKKLEMEISDILKSHKGIPVSISLLPMLYYEKYGRSLQADGYMTESQRHGKAGFNLTKLLARLKNSICLIDRPHGQHSIILAEDAARYRECSIERSEPVGMYPVSYQIYLTFPADSTFSEHDVSNYFKQFGPVKDVRIPIQEKRMYGFVSFVYPETVCDILMKKNPHYICGSRVLVKPYKDKSREAEKTYNGKNKLSMHYQYLDLAIPRKTDSSRVSKHLEEQQQMIELDRRRLACFNFAQESLNQQPCFRYGADDSKLLEDSNGSTLENHFGFMPNVLNNGLSSYVRSRNTSNNFSDKESGHIELPENPFASPPSARGCF